MVPYSPREYWLKRGRLYKKQFKHDKERKLQEEMLINHLMNISPPFSTVLEVGCGFGRITKLVLENFPHITEYLAVDLSPDQIEEARKYVGETWSDRIRFVVSEIQSLDIVKKYDLVLSCSVLMHALPEEIKSIIGKLITMSARSLVNVDWYEDPVPNQRKDTWNYVHQYEAIYKKNVVVQKVERIPIVKKGPFGFDTRQSIFHAELREVTNG